MKSNLPRFTLFVGLIMTLALTACGAGAPAAAPTAAETNTPLPPTVTPTQTLTPTATPPPTRTPTPTITPDVAATEQYNDFMTMVQTVYDAGQISTLEGEYIQLDDFSDEYAMTYGYRWLPTGYNAKSFIIRADFDWEVANQKNYSGCGFKFRQESVSSPGTTMEADYFYITALDGVNGVLMMYTMTFFEHKPAALVQKMKMPDIGSNPYHAQYTLVVTGTSAYTYVNGSFLTEHRLQGNWITNSGPLDYLVLTGSDADYGTRCKITNAELWVIEP